MRTKFAFLVTALVILASAFHASAQQAGKVYRIGYIGPNINPAFRQGLAALGYVEGKNLAFEFREGMSLHLNQAHAENLLERWTSFFQWAQARLAPPSKRPALSRS